MPLYGHPTCSRCQNLSLNTNINADYWRGMSLYVLEINTMNVIVGTTGEDVTLCLKVATNGHSHLPSQRIYLAHYNET